VAAAEDDICVRRLAPGQGLNVRGETGSTIQCCAGTAWITLETGPRVVVLVAGQRFTWDRPGRPLVRAGEGMKDEWGNDTGITAIGLSARLL
jgi:hypothetical protein